MKYVKIFGLLTFAAAALMAFAGTASATLTEAAGDPIDVGDHIHTVSGHVAIKIGGIEITCTDHTTTETVTSNGANHAEATVSKLTFGGCGNNTVTPINEGKGSTITITDEGKGTGALSSSGAEITVLTHSLFLGTRHCIFVTNNTAIGTVTGGTPAKLSIDSAAIPQSETDSLCGNDAEWTGSSTVTSPGTLLID